MRTRAPGTIDILSTIERILPDLAPAHQRVATFALEHHDALLGSSLDELAQGSGVSKATVVRFCQALGYDGLRDLQRSLLPWDTQPAHTPSIGSDPGRNAHSTLAALAASVHSTRRLLHEPSLVQAAHRIVDAKLITWYGLGDSGFLALSADHRCMINGLNSKAITSTHDLMNWAKRFTADDTVVCISRSGRLPILVPTIRHIKENTPARLIAITGDPGSPLAQFADIRLLSAPIDLYVDGQRTTLQSAQMALLDTLLAAVLHLRFPEVETVGLCISDAEVEWGVEE